MFRFWAAALWFRSYGNELWEFDAEGYMMRREASINDVSITEADRRIFGPRPEAVGLIAVTLLITKTSACRG